MPSITPNIGRKVWYWPLKDTANIVSYNPETPCDATIVYVWSDTCVNLRVTDHTGATHVRTSVQPDTERPSSNHATWMPYQVGQAKKEEA